MRTRAFQTGQKQLGSIDFACRLAAYSISGAASVGAAAGR